MVQERLYTANLHTYIILLLNKNILQFSTERLIKNAASDIATASYFPTLHFRTKR